MATQSAEHGTLRLPIKTRAPREPLPHLLDEARAELRDDGLQALRTGQVLVAHSVEEGTEPFWCPDLPKLVIPPAGVLTLVLLVFSI